MKRIAVSADDANGLDAVVSPHFGRCPYFVVVDVEGQNPVTVRAVENPFYGNHQPGQVPGFVNSLGANVMLSGGMGARAFAFFSQYGIEAATGAAGTVRLALERYLSGGLAADPCAESVEHGHTGCTGHDSPGYEKDEAGRLREDAEALSRQLDEAQARLNRLKGNS